MLFSKPDDPKTFIVEYLENVKRTGTECLLTNEDLQTMFGMFDVVNRGVITTQQANAALRSVLGPSADLQSVGVEPDARLTKQQFVESMMTALTASVPYRKT